MSVPHPQIVPPGYRIDRTDIRVDVDAADRFLFRWRAERCARRENARRFSYSYEWRVVRENRRWAVAAFQNILVPAT